MVENRMVATYRNRTQKGYSLAFKMQVVDEIEKGALNQGQAQRKYGIQGNATILTWLRKHGTLDWHMNRPGKCATVVNEMPPPLIAQTPEFDAPVLEYCRVENTSQESDRFAHGSRAAWGGSTFPECRTDSFRSKAPTSCSTLKTR